LKLDPALSAQYDWEGRTIKGHRAQIREHLTFREATVVDTEEMKVWLVAEKLASDQQMEHLKVVVTQRFRDFKIEPPTPDRLERLIRSACSTYEQQLFALVAQRLLPATRILLDDLLIVISLCFSCSRATYMCSSTVSPFLSSSSMVVSIKTVRWIGILLHSAMLAGRTVSKSVYPADT
jgi:hypothetical protein